jgi:hypothetical protein
VRVESASAWNGLTSKGGESFEPGRASLSKGSSGEINSMFATRWILCNERVA